LKRPFFRGEFDLEGSEPKPGLIRGSAIGRQLDGRREKAAVTFSVRRIKRRCDPEEGLRRFHRRDVLQEAFGIDDAALRFAQLPDFLGCLRRFVAEPERNAGRSARVIKPKVEPVLFGKQFRIAEDELIEDVAEI
jgi:hypothetical protein